MNQKTTTTKADVWLCFCVQDIMSPLQEESGCDDDEEGREEEDGFDSDESLVDSDSDSEEKGVFLTTK